MRLHSDEMFNIATQNNKIKLSSNIFRSSGNTSGEISGLSLNTRSELTVMAPEVWINNTLRNNTYNDNLLALMGRGISTAFKMSQVNTSPKMKLYRCTFFDTYGDISFDFVPCSKDSNGANGVYDLIGKKFHEYRRCNLLTRTYNESDSTYTYSFKYPVKTKVTVTFN